MATKRDQARRTASKRAVAIVSRPIRASWTNPSAMLAPGGESSAEAYLGASLLRGDGK